MSKRTGRRPGDNLIQKTISLTIALTTSRRVSKERIRRHIQICSRCRYVRIHKTRQGGRKRPNPRPKSSGKPG